MCALMLSIDIALWMRLLTLDTGEFRLAARSVNAFGVEGPAA